MSKAITTGMAPTFETGALSSRLVAMAGRIGAFVAAKAARRGSRRALAGLSDQMLADIGIDPSLARPSSRYEVSARTMTGLMSLR
jgi:uncharacterized protein YjiS (DUF1127 family)